jgi:RimJ/RimL family protein N-acetyltransferase
VENGLSLDLSSMDERARVPQKELDAIGAIEVFRSRDYRAIRALCTHPSIFPLIADDFHPDPTAWKPPENEQIVYLLARDQQGPFGFGIFHPLNLACWNAHFGFLPRSYGGDARMSFKRMLAWMWKNTTARKVVGEISRDNTLAIRFARSVGCEIYGMNKKSLLRDGVLRDQVCLGISRE